MEKTIDIRDERLGTLSGRDSIYLDALSQDEFGNITFKGEINSSLAENSQNKKWIPYTLKFRGVTIYYACDTDTYYDMENPKKESSFCIIEKSKWLARLPISNAENKAISKHYRLYTYDFVYNIIAEEYTFELDM